MAQAQSAVNNAEADIFRLFRSYGVRAHEMVFFNRTGGKDHSAGFTHAMQSMVDRGLVIREQRHRDAYSLSESGYKALVNFGKA